MKITIRLKIYGILLTACIIHALLGWWGVAFMCLLTEFVIFAKAHKGVST